MPAEAGLLAVRRVAKAFGAARALEGIDLDVRRGEFVALLGPNGAGKTTLFQILSGLFTPDAGTVSAEGHDLRHDPTRVLARLGIVFQQPTLDLELTVADNLRFHASLHGLSPTLSQARIAEELARFGLAEKAEVRVATLSGGNRRRVELARALLHRPAFLLMDEATVGLDPQSRRDLLAHVHALCRAGPIGVLWATHLVDEVEAADRVIVLRQGKTLFAGTPDAMRAQTGKADLSDAFLSFAA